MDIERSGSSMCESDRDSALPATTMALESSLRFCRVYSLVSFCLRLPFTCASSSAFLFAFSSFFAFLCAFCSFVSSKYMGSAKNNAIASKPKPRAPRPKRCHRVHISQDAFHWITRDMSGKSIPCVIFVNGEIILGLTTTHHSK